MESLVVFMVKNIISAGVLFFVYVLALRGRKFHRYNRFYLLGTLLISLLVPLVNFKLYSFPYNLFEDTVSIDHAIVTGDFSAPGFSGHEVVLLLCSAISVFMIVCLLIKIRWIYKMIHKHEVRRMDGYYFIVSELREAPFTFLDKLFWRKTISLNEDAGQKILAHELVHIREKHTYDKLFSQFVLCLIWMNPFYWLIQRELNIVHEFLADAKSIEVGDVAGFAGMLLRSHKDGSYFDPLHPFFNSSVKRRLDMIARPAEPVNYIKRITTVPLLCLLIIVFSFSFTDQKISVTEINAIKITEPIVKQETVFENRVIVKNDTVGAIFNSKKPTLESGKAASLKKGYKKGTDQKEAKHFAEDKLAGIEKLTELQKPGPIDKDKFFKSQHSREKLKDAIENPSSGKNLMQALQRSKNL